MISVFFQVDANMEDLLSHLTTETESSSTIGGKIAFGLAALYLPALPPPVDTFKKKEQRHKPLRNRLIIQQCQDNQ